MVKGRVNLADAKAENALGKLSRWQNEANSLRKKLQAACVECVWLMFGPLRSPLALAWLLSRGMRPMLAPGGGI